MCFIFLITWRCNSILILGLELTDSEKHDLDGPNENPCQAAIEDDIEEEDLNCEKRRNTRVKVKW